MLDLIKKIVVEEKKNGREVVVFGFNYFMFIFWIYLVLGEIEEMESREVGEKKSYKRKI